MKAKNYYNGANNQWKMMGIKKQTWHGYMTHKLLCRFFLLKKLVSFSESAKWVIYSISTWLVSYPILDMLLLVLMLINACVCALSYTLRNGV